LQLTGAPSIAVSAYDDLLITSVRAHICADRPQLNSGVRLPHCSEATMLSRFRLRATGVLSLIWAAVYGIVGLGIGVQPLLMYPRTLTKLIIVDLLRYVATWTVTGAVCGACFAVAIAALGHGRGLTTLPVRRITLIAGALGFLIGATTDPGYLAATTLAVVGAGLAAASLRLAVRTHHNGPASEARAT